eukprot:tig00000622_g2629.t1
MKDPPPSRSVSRERKALAPAAVEGAGVDKRGRSTAAGGASRRERSRGAVRRRGASASAARSPVRSAAVSSGAAHDAVARKRTLALPEDHARIPAWNRRPYVLRGYRHTGRPWRYYLHSAFQLNNETFNIWTHVVAAGLVAGLAAWSLCTELRGIWGTEHAAIFLLFVVGSWNCFASSAFYHTFHGRSAGAHGACMYCDQLGIVHAFTASMLFYALYGFRGEPALQKIYLALHTLSAIFVVSQIAPPPKGKAGGELSPAAAGGHTVRKYAALTSLFVFGLISFAHMAARATPEELPFMAYRPLKTYAYYAAGVVFYATKLPERVRPGGLFDYAFNSHQLWHCAIAAGALNFQRGVVECLRHHARP